MALKLMYITNSPTVALIAEEYGVDRIWIDLETMGKEERQKNLNSVKSHHTIQDVATLSSLLTRSECMVRINPWHEGSPEEIEQVLAANAKRIMLPMWKTAEEAAAFLEAVNRRAATTLLLETREAVECVDEVLKHPLLDEIHIGLNDLHLSYGLDFMFELLSNGTVDRLCQKMKQAGIPYGFGGIARIGDGVLPAERIIMEHYRLGSTRAILSRSFCNTDEVSSMEEVRAIFAEHMQRLREYEVSLPQKTEQELLRNHAQVKRYVGQVVALIKEKKA